MIEPEVVEKIKDIADIVDIISDFITLKKKGSNYSANCPFHNEKTASFSVSPSRGIYKCFGCGKGGNAINFVMEHEKFSYVEALKWIAKKYNIEIIEKELTPEQKEKKDSRESMLIVNSYAQKVFTHNLLETEEGVAVGLSYFKERGFLEPTIKEFELGYARKGWDSFSKEAIGKGYKEKYLLKLGLSQKRDNKPLYDTFRERVMFPIHDLTGKVVGFGGRTLSSKDSRKYLNSVESDIYHKSKVLYGLFFAKKEIAKEDKCFLVEGYTDVISMHQSGIKNVVASSGTALSVEQIRLIKRFSSNITMLFDGDNAGIKAALRGVDIALKEEMNVRVVLLPQGEDPDSYAKTHSPTDFVEFINKNESDFIIFKTKLILDEIKNDPIKKSELINDIINTISVIPSGLTRSLYVKECSTLMEVSEDVINGELNKILYKKRKQNYNNTPPPPPEHYNNEKIEEKTNETQTQSNLNKYKNYEGEIIRMLLKYPYKIAFIIDDGEKEEEVIIADYIFREIDDEIQFVDETYKAILEEVKVILSNNEKINIKYFINHNDQNIANAVANLLADRHMISKMWNKNGNYISKEENNVKNIIDNAVLSYKYEMVLDKLKGIEKQLKEYDDKSVSEEEMKPLLDEYMLYTKYKMEISNQLGNRIVLKQ
jgi:DNA primase